MNNNQLSLLKDKGGKFADCGWGKVLFAQTFTSRKELLDLMSENKDKRDIAFYVKEPHVLLAIAPQELFLDPSHTYRFEFGKKDFKLIPPKGFIIRKARENDIDQINKVLASCNMLPYPDNFLKKLQSGIEILVAEDDQNNIYGTLLILDHKKIFNDEKNGASLWALAVDPQAPLAKVGICMANKALELFKERGNDFIDLSVMHNNKEAIALYEKMGFEKRSFFAVKYKNEINEKLFIGKPPEKKLNPYSKIIIDEARKRGVEVDILGKENNFFELIFGGRKVSCHESLTELTSAIAYQRCANKRITNLFLKNGGLSVPDQIFANDWEKAKEFLQKHKRVVVKPVSGEQGQGITVDVRTIKEMKQAITEAEKITDESIIEQYIDGYDVRIIVINKEVVAAALRKPPEVIGTGKHTISELIKKQSRRREVATGGESTILIDEETVRCIRSTGFEIDDIIPENKRIKARKTANLHTGGTIEDISDEISDEIIEISIQAAGILEIPVVGFDFILPSYKGREYYIIEANERPGLANHEPQPIVEKFMDLLFPQTKVNGA